MGKNKDLAQIIMLILAGMLIPFAGSITLVYGFETIQIVSAFALFIVIFGIELGFVFLYFYLGSRSAEKQLQQLKPPKT